MSLLSIGLINTEGSLTLRFNGFESRYSACFPFSYKYEDPIARYEPSLLKASEDTDEGSEWIWLTRFFDL